MIFRKQVYNRKYKRLEGDVVLKSSSKDKRSFFFTLIFLLLIIIALNLISIEISFKGEIIKVDKNFTTIDSGKSKYLSSFGQLMLNEKNQLFEFEVINDEKSLLIETTLLSRNLVGSEVNIATSMTIYDLIINSIL